MERIDIATSLEFASQRLENAEIPQPTREASSLLEHCLARPRAFLIAHPEYLLSESESSAYKAAIDRRVDREPFQLIVGHQEFYGLDFIVEKRVLIPRPETEQLVERAIEILEPLDAPRFLDLGLGTGCIAISILHNVPRATAVGVDISDTALRLTERNALGHQAVDRLTIIKSDLLSKIQGPFDMIVSNPPYIPIGDATTLQPEVATYDPPDALFAGGDGLDVIRRIVRETPQYLNAGGYLLFEIGQGQSENVKTLFDPGTWQSVRLYRDLQGIGRTVEARMACSPVSNGQH